jgi:NADH-quinone oxidoreductase subunit G
VPVADRVTITVDGRPVEALAGEPLIAAAERAGSYIPRFCWHPRMEAVGMCRMCLVEIEGPRGRALTTSCTTRVADGMVVHTQSEVVKKAQEGVLEYLLANHPLDCPVCDRGGECPLQDQTMAYGPGESRYVEQKRHYPKPIPLSDLVLLDRERCILCARCTRFAEEIAGDPLIEFVSRGNDTQVLTFPGEPFSSYFSGNTVQICPVGALTAVPYRFRARPWDLESVESTCPHCSVGCRLEVQATENRVVRFLGIDNPSTNQGWLCDKGRFGFEYLSSPERLTTPLVRGKEGALEPATWDEALARAASGLREIIDGSGADAVAGLGGARSTNEEAYAFGKFLRATVGTNHLDARLGDALGARFLTGLPHRASFDDLETAGAILVWGPDLKEELPVLYLRVRRAATRLRARLVVVHPRATGLDGVAEYVLRYRPGRGADMLRRLSNGEGEAAGARAALESGPLVAIVGRPGLAEDPRLAEAVAAFAEGFPEGKVLPVARRGNLYGALDMGVAPDLLPGRVPTSDPAAWEALEEAWDGLPGGEGDDAAGIVSGLEEGRIRALVLLGADPAADFPDPARAAAALERADLVVAVDLFLSESSRGADVVFPALAFGEVEGTVTNLEGRVQKVSRLVAGPGQARPAHEILEDLAGHMGHSIGAESAAGLAAEIARVAPAYAGVTWEALERGAGRQGLCLPTPNPYRLPLEAPVEEGGELVLHLARVLYDGGTIVGQGPALARLAGTPSLHLHPDDAARLGVVAGGRARLFGEGGEAELPATLDPSLAPGTVYLPAHLGVAVGAGLRVSVEAVP